MSEATAISPQRLWAITALLNAYEADHPATAEDYDPDNIWDDVIEELPEYDADATRHFTDTDYFALKDGTIIAYDQEHRTWTVDEDETWAEG